MPFQKGRPKTGGRKKGSQTKLALEVQARMEELGCDPIAGMVAIANDPEASRDLRGKMYSELAQYVYPKRKAIEHSGAGGGPIQVNITEADTRL